MDRKVISLFSGAMGLDLGLERAELSGTVASQYRQIGNTVPVGLAEQIGKALLAVADGNGKIKTKRYR